MRTDTLSVLRGTTPLTLLLLVASLGVGCAWWASGLVASGRTAQLVQDQYQRAQVDATVLSSAMDSNLAQAEALPGLLAQEHDIQQVLGTQGPSVRPSVLPLAQRAERWAADPALAAVGHRLGQVVTDFKLSTAWIANAAGDTVALGHAPGLKSALGVNFADRDYFKATQRGQMGRHFALGRINKHYAIYFAAPVSVGGRYVGMVGTSVGLDSVPPLLGDSQVLVTDEHGVVVVAADAALHMQALPNASVRLLSESEQAQRYQRTTFDTLALTPLADAGAHPLYQWPGRGAHPHVWVTRATLDGALQVHVLRDLGQAIDRLNMDRWTLFGLAALVWCLLVGIAALLVAQWVASGHQRAELLALNHELQRRADTDTLTGAASRSRYLQSLRLELERSQRHGLVLCVLSLDVDHFKRVNDTFGHAAGDAVLRHFAAVVQGQLRQTDTLGRVGGEEFSVLLPQTEAQGGQQMAQRIRAAVEATATDWEGQPIAITVSIGGAQWAVGSPLASDQVLAATDRALYQAKHLGRNRVSWWSPDPVSVPDAGGEREADAAPGAGAGAVPSAH